MQCEQQYLLPALQLQPNDVAVYLDFAVFCQSSENIARAESHYAKALSFIPVDYAIPGYLHRVQTLDRLLSNYHRFCSIFNSRQTNVLAKALAVAKRGEQLRFMVAKMNQYTAIYPADAVNVGRVNAIYLSDDEVCAFLNEHGSAIAVEKLSPGGVVTEEEEQKLITAVGSKQSLRKLSNWKNGSQKSLRQTSARKLSKETASNDTGASDTAGAAGGHLVAKKLELVQLHQSEFRGLDVRPDKLAAPSAKRSRVTISRDQAELILKHVVFINTAKTEAIASQEIGRATGGYQAAVISKSGTSSLVAPDAPLTYIAVLPSLLKLRQQRHAKSLRSFASIDIQRVFRGFQFRAHVRREVLIQRIQQHQVDHMLAHLHANFVVRERRRMSAVAIQRVFKGLSLRNHLRCWHIEATNIQRVFRGYRGRKRALAFRDGNCTFYMAEKVFQRGVEISGRRVMLLIEKVSGLSIGLHACCNLPAEASRCDVALPVRTLVSLRRLRSRRVRDVSWLPVAREHAHAALPSQLDLR